MFRSAKCWGSPIPETILTSKTILLTIREDVATCSRAIWPLKGFAFSTRDLPHPTVAISCASQKDMGLGVPFCPLEEESKQKIWQGTKLERKWLLVQSINTFFTCFIYDPIYFNQSILIFYIG